MNDRNVVVSGFRLGLFAAPPEHADPEDAVACAENLAAMVGAPVSAMAAELPDIDAAAEAERIAAPPGAVQDALLLAKFQKAVRLLQEADKNPGVLATVEDRTAALLQSQLAEQAERRGRLQRAVADGREAKFDERDVRWVFSLLSWIGKLRPHAWLPPPPRPESAPDRLKLAIVGDWGTGLYGAPEFQTRIARERDIGCFIHLGDVYYAGTVKETEKNFLRYWPSAPATKSRACNGNHEMYSGGYGYFDIILPEFGQTSSCFAMQNMHWLIVGLDTAYADHDLAHDQQLWLADLMRVAAEQRVVLLSHHQPFSHFEKGGDELVDKLSPVLDSGRIAAWYWGHEHRCVVYDRHPRWAFLGRCIGHSGYPYFRQPSLASPKVNDPPPVGSTFWRELPARPDGAVPRAVLLDGPNPFLAEHREDYGPNGWVTLEFSGPQLTERYYRADGELLWEHPPIM